MKGCKPGVAAERAGYSGGRAALRKAGHAVKNSIAVRKLVTLATAGGAQIPDKAADLDELERILSRQARQGDTQAANALIRIAEMRRGAGEDEETDGRGPERLAMAFAEVNGGAAAYLVLHQKNYGAIAGAPMLHLLATKAATQTPDVWAALRNLCDGRELERLDANLMDDEFQEQFFIDLKIPLVPRDERAMAAGRFG
jgi:hypothetical protein